MKLIKTTKLVFAEGKTQRVYEIDLCEVGPRQFVVNFRYGKVGAPLKDGSKTVAPVGEAEANKVFDKLVQQQIEKGYALEGAPRPAPVVTAAPALASASRPRTSGEPPGESRQRARVLELLRTAVRTKREPTLSRMIWRAGELRLREAEPILLDLLARRTNDMRDYCIAFALGRLGTSEATSEVLGRIFADRATPAHIRRMATLALQELSDEATRLEFAGHLAQSLPAQLQNVGDDPQAFAKRLDDYLATAKPEAFSVVETLYMMNTPIVRPAVLAQLAKVKFETPYWQTVRHVFKAAEYRRDARVFGLIAYRFEKVRAAFATNYSYRYARGNQPPRSYGSRTRRYLRRRAWRTMRRAGELGDLDYVKLAVGVLLAFTDADAGTGERGLHAYWSFNWILHAHNPEYRASPNGTVFRTQRTRAPIPAREEAFPALWDQRPEGLMHLLAESQCRPVAEFAAKIIRANPAFLDQLDDDDLLVLLGRPYQVVAELGFELARKRYDRANPNLPLLIGLAQCAFTPARTQAFTWLDEQRTRLIGETGPLAELVVSGHLDTRDYARRVLRATPVPNAGHLIARVIAIMLSLSNTTADDTRARDATLTLTSTMATHLGAIGQTVIRDLLAHPLSGVQELGAELLLRAGAASGTISDEAMVSILHSEHANVRAVGMRLLAEMPDIVLAKMELLLVRLSTDKNADLRGASRPLVVRIARNFPVAGETIVRALIEALLRRKLPEDAPAHVLGILREDLADLAAALDVNDVWRLLQSQSPHAQELGGVLLQRMDPNALALDQIVKLASHDILSVRQAAWSSFERGLDRVKGNLAEAARILDAKWDDSRTWARDFFRTKLGAESFTADVLVTILDSVREDVQAFGRELTTKYFREEDGPALMAKLAEHPSTAVQLYTTNYLARFARDAPGKLESLMPYFTSVLSRVNRGRIAKQRVLAFLEQEGVKNPEAAKIVLTVLHRVSATMAIELRAAAVGSMVAIHNAQPSVPVPFTIKRPMLRVSA